MCIDSVTVGYFNMPTCIKRYNQFVSDEYVCDLRLITIMLFEGNNLKSKNTTPSYYQEHTKTQVYVNSQHKSYFLME